MAVYDRKVELLHLIYIGNRQVSDKEDTRSLWDEGVADGGMNGTP